MRRWGLAGRAASAGGLIALAVRSAASKAHRLRHVGERGDVEVASHFEVLDDEEAVEDLAAGSGIGEEADGGENAARVVEFTDERLQSQLEKTYSRRPACREYLTPQERANLSRMIFDVHYQPSSRERTGGEDRAMLYQAELEVQWLEEWAGERARAQGWADAEVRRLIKRSVLERVDLHKPLSYILGFQPFYGCHIECSPPLLCPRAETEMWTHWYCATYLQRATQPLRVVDVCSGTGCIGIAIAKHVPHATVTAVDILEEAVVASRANASRNGIPAERYTAAQGDMLSGFLEAAAGGREPARVRPELAGTIDAIVANPPYIFPQQYAELPVSIRHWESYVALVGDPVRAEKQYTYFKDLCVYGHQLLKPRCHRDPALRDAPNMVIEIGQQGNMVAELMEASRLWTNVEIHLDYAQQQRWITATSKP